MRKIKVKHLNFTQPTSGFFLLTNYVARLKTGAVSELYRLSPELEGLEIGPGLLTVIGGPPGVGKTAIASKIAFEALKLNEKLWSLVIANAESGFDVIAQREFARRTGIDARKLRHGGLSEEEQAQIDQAVSEMEVPFTRLGIMNPPFSIGNLMNLGRSVAPGLLVVDYLQKFAPTDGDGRQGVNAVMACLREFAMAGWSVVCLSATKRDSTGKYGPKELGLSSFRESGEIEYNADSAYVLVDKGTLTPSQSARIELKCVKNRHGELKSFELDFDRKRMEFKAAEALQKCKPNAFSNGSRK